MESNKVTPFGEYGVHINDSRQNSICKPDMTRLSECEYLMQRGCSFDVYKWSGTDYEMELNFNGNNFNKNEIKPSLPYFNGMPSMHIWFETIEDLQKWLGQYYDSAITAMLVNKNGDNSGWAYLNDAFVNPPTQQSMTIGQGIAGQVNKIE